MSALATWPAALPQSLACAALGLDRSGLYPRPPRVRAVPAGQPRQLGIAERAALLTLLHHARFCDEAPRQVYARLLSEGTALASISTLYRLLRAEGESTERRALRPAQRHAVPRLVASAPNQVWTWDITKLPTLVRGVFLCLYVILDLYSRYVVGWMISAKENGNLAKHLFRRVLSAHQVSPKSLVVHQDRGAPMIAHSFTDLLAELGVERSYSRPRVSNDNAVSESHFKTLKFTPSYPGCFEHAEHARSWVGQFVSHYQDRPHEGIALYTPQDLFAGRVEQVHAIRQAALDKHYALHPERYVHGRPQAAKPPATMTINPADGEPARTLSTLLKSPGAFSPKPEPTQVNMPEIVI